MITIEQLSSFVCAAQCGSFSATARQLGKSQGAISSAIAKLEQALNVKLYDRSRKRPQLTEQGRLLLPTAEQLLRSTGQLQAFVDSISRQPEEKVRLGLDPLVPMPLIESCLEKTGSTFPHTQITLRRDQWPHLRALLVQGELNLVLSGSTELAGADLQVDPLGEIPYCFVAADRAALTGRAPLDRPSLTAERQIGLQGCHPTELPGAPASWQADSQEDLLRLVSMGLGWAQVPQVLYREYAEVGHLAQLEVAEGVEVRQVSLSLIRHSHSDPGPALTFLCEQLQASLC